MRSTRSSFRSVPAIAAAALAAAALAACGGGDESAKSDREKFEEAALKHAQCMREYGVDVPDPKPGQGGVILVGPGEEGGEPAQLRRAEKECEKHLRDLPPPKLSEEKKEEMRDAALAHARCMREQGINFPDPKFGPDGSITVKVEDGRLNPDDPKMQAAEKACARHMPDLGRMEPAP